MDQSCCLGFRVIPTLLLLQALETLALKALLPAEMNEASSAHVTEDKKKLKRRDSSGRRKIPNAQILSFIKNCIVNGTIPNCASEHRSQLILRGPITSDHTVLTLVAGC